MNNTIRPYFNKQTQTLFLNRVRDTLTLERLKDIPQGIDLNIYVTTITEKQNTRVNYYCQKKMNDEDKKKLTRKLRHINLDRIIMYGDGNKSYTSYGIATGFLQREDKKRVTYSKMYYSPEEKQFRTYERSYDSWKDILWLVNSCPDSKMSWQSAMRKLGGKAINGLDNLFIPHYVVLWYDTLSLEEVIETHGL